MQKEKSNERRLSDEPQIMKLTESLGPTRNAKHTFLRAMTTYGQSINPKKIKRTQKLKSNLNNQLNLKKAKPPRFENDINISHLSYESNKNKPFSDHKFNRTRLSKQQIFATNEEPILTKLENEKVEKPDKLLKNISPNS